MHLTKTWYGTALRPYKLKLGAGEDAQRTFGVVAAPPTSRSGLSWGRCTGSSAVTFGPVMAQTSPSLRPRRRGRWLGGSILPSGCNRVLQLLR